jgi:hypothetical protein
MSSAGCSSIYYGIESGSERMQKISKKHLDLGLFEPTLKTTQRLKMSSTVSLITGYPEETKQDQDATLNLIGSCFWYTEAPLNVQLHLLTPEPGTELMEARRAKILFDGHISDFNFPMLEADDAGIIERHPEVFVNHHYFPSVLPRSRHIFVTTAYETLYGLGFAVLRYVLRHYNQMLSELIDSIQKWAEGSGGAQVCDDRMVESYFKSRFGEGNHLPGLVRYMLRASELRRRAVNEPAGEAATRERGEGTYRLSRRSSVLDRVPDCPRILERLTAGDEVPEAGLLRKRFIFLLHLPRPETDLIRNFRLNRGSMALLNYFDTPRIWPDDGSFQAETGYPAPPPGFIEGFIERGVLEPARHDT